MYYYLQVNPNGIITFLTDRLFYLTPQPFPVIGNVYIAPYWFDNSILTSNADGIISTVHYRQAAGDSTLLTRVAREIRTVFPNVVEFQPVNLQIITWSISNLQRNGSSQGNDSNMVM